MTPSAHRFVLAASVPLAEAEMTLHLSLIAVEALFGPAAVRLDARHRVDPAGWAVVVDASTAVGAALAKVFATLLAREFGDDAFAVAPAPAIAADPAGGPRPPSAPAAAA